MQREVGRRPGGIVNFLDFFPSQRRLLAAAGARFSVTFDCPKVTKGHRGRFKPPPGPPGEGAGGLWCAFPKVWRPRPKAPLTRNGPGSLTMRVCARKLLAPLGRFPQHREVGRRPGGIVGPYFIESAAPKPPLCKGRWVRRTRRDCGGCFAVFDAYGWSAITADGPLACPHTTWKM